MSELPTRTADLQAIADAAWKGWQTSPIEPFDWKPYLEAFNPEAVKALLAVVEAAKAHCHHVNEEWDRVAAMRPQDPEVWERWESERERLIEVTCAALAALHDTEGR